MYKEIKMVDEYILDSEEDVKELPIYGEAGSIAYTSDMTVIYQLSPSHVWVKVEGKDE